MIEDMKKEAERPNELELTEGELEIFDLLAKGKKTNTSRGVACNSIGKRPFQKTQ